MGQVVCPGCAEDVSCAELYWGASLCQIHDVFEEQPVLGCEQGRASTWAVSARSQDAVHGEMAWSQARLMQGCVGQCFWRKGLADLPPSMALLS